MSNRLSYLEESTVEKHQFEQMESKVFTVIKNYLCNYHGNFKPLFSCHFLCVAEKRTSHAVGFGRII